MMQDYVDVLVWNMQERVAWMRLPQGGEYLGVLDVRLLNRGIVLYLSTDTGPQRLVLPCAAPYDCDEVSRTVVFSLGYLSEIAITYAMAKASLFTNGSPCYIDVSSGAVVDEGRGVVGNVRTCLGDAMPIRMVDGVYTRISAIHVPACNIFDAMYAEHLWRTVYPDGLTHDALRRLT